MEARPSLTIATCQLSMDNRHVSLQGDMYLMSILPWHVMYRERGGKRESSLFSKCMNRNFWCVTPLADYHTSFSNSISRGLVYMFVLTRMSIHLTPHFLLFMAGSKTSCVTYFSTWLQYLVYFPLTAGHVRCTCSDGPSGRGRVCIY
jgi:hypothetical protein